MATDVRKPPQVLGNWKVLVVIGVLLFVIGFGGLAFGPIGVGMPVEWTAFTLLNLFGLGLVMYGLARAV